MTKKNLWCKSIYLPLLFACIPLTACTPEKAKALRSGAVQFKTESIACIDAINVMHQKELEAPPRTAEEIQEEFINNILSSDSSIILPNEVGFALEPYAPPPLGEQWQEFTNKLNTQYISFANIYDDLESGSFTATESVQESAEYAEILTIQMAGFTQSINDNPPVLLQYRTAIAADLTRLKNQYQVGVSADEKQEIRNAATDLLTEWQRVKTQEEELRDGKDSGRG
ncbi:MAG: hypothetical protein AAF652_21210 [Cyanobacteria bacterium P01_C01_bin.72]